VSITVCHNMFVSMYMSVFLYECLCEFEGYLCVSMSCASVCKLCV
jgi:hypothetical protein